MNLNKVIYKTNNEAIKKFQILDNNETNLTFFILSDFSKIPVMELVRLLNNDRKIIIDDKCVIEIDKMYEVFELLDQQEKIQNLKISKEALIKLWIHQEYADLMFELEISDSNNADVFVKSDLILNNAIKLKYLDRPEYLLKVLDSSIYTKKLVLSQFQDINVDLKKEFKKIIDFGNFVRECLIPSSGIYVSQISNNQNFICNVIDIDNNFFPYGKRIEKWGILSAFDYDQTSISNLNYNELTYIPYAIKKQYNKISWIDALKTKKILKKHSIDNIILEDIDSYNYFEEIKICTEYSSGNYRTKHVDEFETSNSNFPLFTKFPGWKKQLDLLENPEEVPYELIIFLHELKRILEVKKIKVKLRNLKIEV